MAAVAAIRAAQARQALKDAAKQAGAGGKGKRFLEEDDRKNVMKLLGETDEMKYLVLISEGAGRCLAAARSVPFLAIAAPGFYFPVTAF